MRIINTSNNAVLAEEAMIASGLLERMRGLLGKNGLQKGQAIVLTPCTAVHTFFMRFSIDVLFVDSANKIIRAIPDLKPWRLTGIYPLARLCVELPAGTLDATQTRQGHTIRTVSS